MRNPNTDSGRVWWMDPQRFAENRLAGRADLHPYASGEDALADRNPAMIPLDGTWRFRVVPRVQDTPRDFAQPARSETEWADIRVPGDWTMQGFGKPCYTNWRMPFADPPPTVPEANPTGLYQTTFDLPSEWAGRRVVIHFAGVSGAFRVWLNGAYVGLSKGSRVPAEFDLTPHAKPSRNVLAVQVVQWSDASFIEDQDHWWQAGIDRAVRLYATGPVWIQDVFARGGYQPESGAGHLDLEVAVGGIPVGLAGGTTDTAFRVRARLFDPAGVEVKLPGSATGPVPTGLNRRWKQREGVAELSIEAGPVRPWSSESPALYTLVVSLVDSSGRECAATRLRLGFRCVEVRDRQLLINGRKVYIKGANHHDHHPRTGRTVDRATMREDVRLLKRFHFNAIRCSHYPPDPHLLDLCDEFGLYVIDEADIECHHYMWLSSEPRYAAAFLDRGMRMVQRDRNHPSVILWSLGNESGYGPHHDAMAGWIRRVDPSRPLHCEGACWHTDWKGGENATDVVCPMYPPIERLLEWARTTTDRRPLIMCEFSHAMGNSNGSLADYWAAIEATPGLQGGLIWEWLDHGIEVCDASGRPYFAYGGDFGETVHDGNFVCDGLVGPDRAPHPALWECKKVFQPIAAEAFDPARRTVRIRNKHDFTSLAPIVGSFEVLVDGECVQSGPFPVPALPPGGTAPVEVPFQPPRLGPGQESHLVLRFTDPRERPLLGRDFEVACEQFALAAVPPLPAPPPRTGAWRISKPRRTGAVRARAGAVELAVDTAAGRLTGWKVGNADWIEAGPQVCVWRAPIDNDGIRYNEFRRGLSGTIRDHGRKPLVRWCDLGLHESRHACDACDVAAEHGVLTVRGRCRVHGDDEALSISDEFLIQAEPDGVLRFVHVLTVPPPLDDLPRLGVRLCLPVELENVEWFGRGPHENYADRKSAALAGRHCDTVLGRYTPYVVPQEHGNVTDVRWLALTDAAGAGLRIEAEGLIEANVSRYSVEALSAARHTCDIELEPCVHLHLDARQRGLGTGSCGPGAREEYRIPAGVWRLAYRIVPMAGGDKRRGRLRAD